MQREQRGLWNDSCPAVGSVLLKSVGLDVTEAELFRDWNERIDEFGVIEDDC